MSGKTLSALAPALALAALAMVPAMAWGTTAQVPKAGGGTEQLAVGSKVQGKSIDLTFDTGSAKFQCIETIFHGKLTKNGTTDPDVQASIESGEFAPICATDGLAGAIVDISLSGFPWTLQVQQPNATSKVFIAHLTGDIKFKFQSQISGTSVSTCEYQASNIQFTGIEKGGIEDDVLTVDASAGAQFTRVSGSFPCEPTSTFQGHIRLESETRPITIDMT